ncbi:MAG: hypothetical protein VCA36_05375, partial [Opitutales bacterium]
MKQRPLALSATLFFLCLLLNQVSSAAEVRFPPVNKLPVIKGLPDPFLKPDGGRVENMEEWTAQRERLKALLAHYMYGKMPPRPTAEQVAFKKTFSQKAFSGKALQENYTLTLTRGKRSVDLRISLFR